MAIRINGNQISSTLNRNLNRATSGIQDNFRALSSGSRLTRPSIDPAALQMADQISSEIRNSAQAARNISDAVSFLNIADGALASASDITVRLEELATQAANGALSDSQRTALNNEFQALTSELDRIASQTRFNDKQVLGTTTTIQSGTDSSPNSQLKITLAKTSSESLGLDDKDILSQENAQEALDSLKDARSTLSASRAEVGASQSRLTTSFNNLQEQRLNNIEARSRIADADIASKSSQLVSNRILQEANTSLMAVNNNSLSNVLKLLKT
jgi:flagellin